MGKWFLEIDFPTIVVSISAIATLILQLLLCFKLKKVLINFSGNLGMRFLSWSTKNEEPINDSSICHVGSNMEFWYYSKKD